MKELGQYPIDAHLQEIGAALQHGTTCLLKAEPGAGKTTRVPLYLLSKVTGGILVLEPRRLAARLSAERCAWFLDEPCGQQVGFRIRQAHQVSEATRLTFITEGLFVRLMRNNPTLQGVSLVILDEFHERNIHTDIALSLVRRLQQEERPDLKLVVMSATLDTVALEAYLENAAVFDIAGRTYPVEVEYVPGENPGGLPGKHWLDRVSGGVQQMLRDHRCPGDILVFLAGIGEIMALKQMLKRTVPEREASILPLAADLPFAEQQRVFAKGGVRKIVLSTNVAETSVTIPGVTGVIDGGVAKIPAHAPWSGLPTLEVRRISQSSARQRAGRAGRTRSGVVYRLYSKPEFINRDPFTLPDIQRLDLSHTILELLNLGIRLDFMPWFEPPADKNIDSAFHLLTLLGAIGGDGELTAFGKKLSALPLHPRLAAVVLEGLSRGCGEDALLAACLISGGFVLKRDAFLPREDEEGEPCDLAMQIDLLKAAFHRKKGISPYPLQFLDNTRKRRVLELYATLAKTCRLAAVPLPARTDARKLSRCLLRGYPDRVAQRRDIDSKRRRKKGPALYHFCLGRGGVIGPGSFVSRREPGFLLAIDAVENLKKDAARGITIRACATLPPEILPEDPGKMLKYQRREEFDPKDGSPALWEDLFYGNLKVESRKAGLLREGQDLAQVLALHWPFPFDSDEPLRIYHRRVELLNRGEIPHHCPVFRGEMLEIFFGCICDEIKSLKELPSKPLEEYIDQQLSESDRAILEAYVPLEMRLGNGKRLRIRYPEGKDPWAEILLQDCFGLKETPAILQGKQKVILHLLGPNRRPAQITADLAKFWQGSYHQVRKELSRRYPKHHWPENPACAAPVMLKKQAL